MRVDQVFAASMNATSQQLVLKEVLQDFVCCHHASANDESTKHDLPSVNNCGLLSDFHFTLQNGYQLLSVRSDRDFQFDNFDWTKPTQINEPEDFLGQFAL